jgi:hypothetical protein
MAWSDVAENVAALGPEEFRLELWLCGLSADGGLDALRDCWIGNLDGLDRMGREEMRKLLRFLAYARKGKKDHKKGVLRRWPVGGRRVGMSGADVPFADVENAVRSEIMQMSALRMEHPMSTWFDLRRTEDKKRMQEELEEHMSCSSSDGDVAEEEWGDPFEHEGALREFGDEPYECAPHNCRLCVYGCVDFPCFLKHLNDKHGGETMYRSRVQRLLAMEYPGKIRAQRGRATVEEGAFRMRTGASAWPELEEGGVVDPGAVPGRQRMSCVCCATEGWDRDFLQHSWSTLWQDMDKPKKAEIEKHLCVSRYVA